MTPPEIRFPQTCCDNKLTLSWRAHSGSKSFCMQIQPRLDSLDLFKTSCLLAWLTVNCDPVWAETALISWCQWAMIFLAGARHNIRPVPSSSSPPHWIAWCGPVWLGRQAGLASYFHNFPRYHHTTPPSHHLTIIIKQVRPGQTPPKTAYLATHLIQISNINFNDRQSCLLTNREYNSWSLLLENANSVCSDCSKLSQGWS